mmetsp:Transcript_74641/g.242518  ORF Transcript_74641/g.242518 Transcript_74641/m.242518 type:complete len:530 (-) Transcript_74641:860-2449(-)
MLIGGEVVKSHRQCDGLLICFWSAISERVPPRLQAARCLLLASDLDLHVPWLQVQLLRDLRGDEAPHNLDLGRAVAFQLEGEVNLWGLRRRRRRRGRAAIIIIRLPIMVRLRKWPRLRRRLRMRSRMHRWRRGRRRCRGTGRVAVVGRSDLALADSQVRHLGHRSLVAETLLEILQRPQVAGRREELRHALGRAHLLRCLEDAVAGNGHAAHGNQEQCGEAQHRAEAETRGCKLPFGTATLASRCIEEERTLAPRQQRSVAASLGVEVAKANLADESLLHLPALAAATPAAARGRPQRRGAGRAAEEGIPAPRGVEVAVEADEHEGVHRGHDDPIRRDASAHEETELPQRPDRARQVCEKRGRRGSRSREDGQPGFPVHGPQSAGQRHVARAGAPRVAPNIVQDEDVVATDTEDDEERQEIDGDHLAVAVDHAIKCIRQREGERDAEECRDREAERAEVHDEVSEDEQEGAGGVLRVVQHDLFNLVAGDVVSVITHLQVRSGGLGQEWEKLPLDKRMKLRLLLFVTVLL